MRNLLPLAFLFSACGGGIGSGNAALVGTWTATPGSATLTYTFSADGNFTFSDTQNGSTNTSSGRFTTSGQQIVMDYMATRRVRVSEGYYISGDRLAIRAITAEGSLQGIV